LDLNRFFPNSVPDSCPDEIRTITIDQILQHRGGWDRSISGDPVFMSKKISEDLQLTGLPTQDEIVRWTLSRPLDFQPGDRRAYSNFGFLLLGLVIEEITGSDYVEWTQQEMKVKCGIDPSQIDLARTFTEDRDCREPWYSHPGEGLSILDYLTPVPYPDGAFHIEIMEAHGGLIMSPQAYMKFLEHYWISGRPRDNTKQNWTFFGSLPGTYTLGRQKTDGWNFVVFFNQRRDRNFSDYSDIRIILDEISEKISASFEPTKM
jgi:CubicO group peptidase (beta-lactamase class C family)